MRLFQLKLFKFSGKHAFVLFPLALLLLAAGGEAWSKEETPGEIYMKYHKVLLDASNVQAIVPFMCKRVVNEINSTPEGERNMMFEVMKGMTPRTVQVTAESAKGDEATVKVTGGSPPTPDATGTNLREEKSEGSVKFIREDGAWKIDKESWKSSENITPLPD